MRLTAAIFVSSASAFSLKYHTTFCTTSLLLVPFGMHTRTRLIWSFCKVLATPVMKPSQCARSVWCGLVPMADAALRQALKKLGWATKYSPHGTRTTGSTRLNEMGYRPDAIEAQLAHAEPNSVRRTYNHATYLDERRVMMQDWAHKLDQWKSTHSKGQ